MVMESNPSDETLRTVEIDGLNVQICVMKKKSGLCSPHDMCEYLLPIFLRQFSDVQDVMLTGKYWVGD